MSSLHNFKHLLLEQRLTPDLYQAIADEVCIGWTAEVRHASPGAVDDIVYARHDKAITFLLPWLIEKGIRRDATIVDFGCGSGSSTVALAHFFQHVVGVDIEEREVNAARTRAQLMGVNNVEFCWAGPTDIVGAVLEHRPDCIIFHAVVEHLTDRERLDYLSRLWRGIDEGAVITITETPNRYAYFDGHTAVMPFFHLLPDEIALAYVKQSPRPGLAEAFEAVRHDPDALSELRHRLGLGVGYQDFEAGFGEALNEVTIGDGFDDALINMFPIDINDQLLLSYFQAANIPVPAGFARSVLAAAFRKPASSEERTVNADRNAARSREIIATHAGLVPSVVEPTPIVETSPPPAEQAPPSPAGPEAPCLPESAPAGLAERLRQLGRAAFQARFGRN